MSEECKCDPILDNISNLKSSNSSLSFKLCNDNSNSVLLPMPNLTKQLTPDIISTDGLDAGEYLINFDSSGNASYIQVNNTYDDYILREYEVILGGDPAITESSILLSLSEGMHTFSINSLPPLGVTPTHVKLNIGMDISATQARSALMLDVNNNTIIYADTIARGVSQHRTSVYGVRLPITFNLSSGKYEFIINNLDTRFMYIHAQGFVGINNQSGLNGNTFVINEEILSVVHLNHDYNSSNNTAQTVVEWVTDPDLDPDQSYIVRIDSGRGIFSDFVVDASLIECPRQRLVVNWSSGNGVTLSVDVVVIQGDRVSGRISSGNGGESEVTNTNCITTVNI